MKKFREVIFPYDIINSFRDDNPFCISFIYIQGHNPFVIKGGRCDVEFYLKKFMINKKPFVEHRTMWYHGKQRTIYIINGLLPDYIGYISGFNRADTGRFEIVVFRDRKKVFSKHIRRVPRKWVKELDQFTMKGQFDELS